MPSSDELEAGVAALRRLRSNGDRVVLFRPGALGGDPAVRVMAKPGDQHRRSAFIDGGTAKEVTWADVVVALQSLGWSFEEPNGMGLIPTEASRTYVIRTDADLVQIAEDSHTALDVLMPSQFGQPLNGARFGPYSEMLIYGCMSSLPSLLLGLAVGSVILLIWFNSEWDSGLAWIEAILAAILGSFLIPTALVKVTESSDRLHDAAEAVQFLGLMVLPAVIAGIVLVAATVAY